MPIAETRTHVLPQDLETAVEIERLAASLRENCISTLISHGKLERSRGLGRVLGRINVLNWSWMEESLTMEERLARHVFRSKIKIEDREDPFSIAIMSLGGTSPEDANHL